MKLSTREAARLLRVPEAKLLQWIRAGVLPAHRSQERYWLNEVELLEWAASRGAEVDPALGERWESAATPSLSAALAAGGIHYGVPGADKAGVLEAVVERLPLGEGDDPEFVLQVLLAREALGSTGVGEGIAIPHVRNPLVLHVEQPLLTLCFLSHAVDFGALDGQPVDVLFALVSPSVRAHLHLLSRLSYALRDPVFRGLLRRAAPATAIQSELVRIEGTLST